MRRLQSLAPSASYLHPASCREHSARNGQAWACPPALEPSGHESGGPLHRAAPLTASKMHRSTYSVYSAGPLWSRDGPRPLPPQSVPPMSRKKPEFLNAQPTAAATGHTHKSSKSQKHLSTRRQTQSLHPYAHENSNRTQKVRTHTETCKHCTPHSLVSRTLTQTPWSSRLVASTNPRSGDRS